MALRCFRAAAEVRYADATRVISAYANLRHLEKLKEPIPWDSSIRAICSAIIFLSRLQVFSVYLSTRLR